MNTVNFGMAVHRRTDLSGVLLNRTFRETHTVETLTHNEHIPYGDFSGHMDNYVPSAKPGTTLPYTGYVSLDQKTLEPLVSFSFRDPETTGKNPQNSQHRQAYVALTLIDPGAANGNPLPPGTGVALMQDAIEALHRAKGGINQLSTQSLNKAQGIVEESMMDKLRKHLPNVGGSQK